MDDLKWGKKCDVNVVLKINLSSLVCLKQDPKKENKSIYDKQGRYVPSGQNTAKALKLEKAEVQEAVGKFNSYKGHSQEEPKVEN